MSLVGLNKGIPQPVESNAKRQAPGLIPIRRCVGPAAAVADRAGPAAAPRSSLSGPILFLLSTNHLLKLNFDARFGSYIRQAVP